MTEKTDNLEEQLLNGVEEKKQSFDLPPIVQKLWTATKNFFTIVQAKKKSSEKNQFGLSLGIVVVLVIVLVF